MVVNVWLIMKIFHLSAAGLNRRNETTVESESVLGILHLS